MVYRWAHVAVIGPGDMENGPVRRFCIITPIAILIQYERGGWGNIYIVAHEGPCPYFE